MRNCNNCKFMIDYGLFLYCKLKNEIIRHEKRTALFCKFHRPIFSEGPAIEEFAEALAEFLNNYPKGA